MSLVTIVTCVSLSSCSKDEEDPNDGWADYYYQLYNVGTNLVDKDGNSLAESLLNEWKDGVGADSEYRIKIGHCDRKTAQGWFDQTIQAQVDLYKEAACEKLPENGVINYRFVLGKYDGDDGDVLHEAIIKVTNDNVTIE